MATTTTRRKTVLHIGCGTSSLSSMDVPADSYIDRKVMRPFPRKIWEEIRVDLNPKVEPDVIADAAELPFEDESADALVCIACLEHLPEKRAGQALMEFHRVLRTGARMILQVPNLEAAAREIVEGRGWHVLYDSAAGSVRAIDIVYGHQQMASENPLMSHRTGFTTATFGEWLAAVGFDGDIEIAGWDLWAYVTKVQKERDDELGCLYHRPV